MTELQEQALNQIYKYKQMQQDQQKDINLNIKTKEKQYQQYHKYQPEINIQFIQNIIKQQKQQNHPQKQKNNLNKQLIQNSKLQQPKKQNQKQIINYDKFSTTKSFTKNHQIKTKNSQPFINLKTQQIQSKTYKTSAPKNYLDSSLASDLHSKNQNLMQELQKRKKILQLYQEKNKLQHRVHISTQLNEIKKKNRLNLIFNTKTQEDQQKKNILIPIQKKPFVFLSPKQSYNKLNFSRSQLNKINKSSILPKLKEKSVLCKKNPQYKQDEIKKAQKAVSFIARVNKESKKRELKYKKFQQYVIIDNILDVSLSCNKKRCRRQVLQGKVRQLQKQL